MTKSDELQSRAIRELCPPLRRILKVELEAGNSVAALKDDWGFVVVLSEPFVVRHELAGTGLSYRAVESRSEWKAEINSGEYKHTLACGFGAGWKPPPRIIRHGALYTLFFVFMLWQLVTHCTRR